MQRGKNEKSPIIHLSSVFSANTSGTSLFLAYYYDSFVSLTDCAFVDWEMVIATAS